MEETAGFVQYSRGIWLAAVEAGTIPRHPRRRRVRPMRLPIMLAVLVCAAVVAAWWWLGAAVPMPASPLAAGEKLYCVSYAPFRSEQSPFEPALRIDAGQI